MRKLVYLMCAVMIFMAGCVTETEVNDDEAVSETSATQDVEESEELEELDETSDDASNKNKDATKGSNKGDESPANLETDVIESPGEAEGIPDDQTDALPVNPYIPKDYGQAVGLGLSVDELPLYIHEDAIMLYPNCIITDLWVQFLNTDDGSSRWVSFFDEDALAGIAETEIRADEIVGMYSLDMLTMDTKDTVDAYYDAMGPDEYSTNISSVPYPIYNRPGGEGGHYALINANPSYTGEITRISDWSDALLDEGYITFIYAGCEWIPE